MRVHVTAKDIENGRRFKARCCPVSHAISRRIDKDVTVDPFRAMYTEYDTNGLRKETAYWLPQKAIDFIARFDNGQSVDPIRFTLNELLGSEFPPRRRQS